MIRFEVTGATPEEFAQNAMKAWGLLAIGLQAALAQVSPPGTPPSSTASSLPLQAQTNGSESSSTASKADEVSEAVVDFVMEMNRRGGLIQEKIDERERKKLASDKVDDLFVEEASAKPTKTAKNSSKGPKLDDLKTRLSEVIVAATERWDQKRANAYARKLLGAFEVAKLGDLKPEVYETFMAVSEHFVLGTAAE